MSAYIVEPHVMGDRKITFDETKRDRLVHQIRMAEDVGESSFMFDGHEFDLVYAHSVVRRLDIIFEKIRGLGDVSDVAIMTKVQ